MKHSLNLPNLKSLILYNDLKANTNLVLNTQVLLGRFSYNLKLLNFTYLKDSNNKLLFNNRILNTGLLNIQNCLIQLQNVYSTELILIGLGFKVLKSKNDNRLHFELHFSHTIIYQVPQDVTAKCRKKKILLFGLNKQRVLDTAIEIKSLRVPNAYKGKGIRFLTETVKLKPGKQR